MASRLHRGFTAGRVGFSRSATGVRRPGNRRGAGLAGGPAKENRTLAEISEDPPG